MMKQEIAIIGGGASALSLASFIDGDRYEVTIYERNKTVGRKFLVAGKGGFNLTHSEPIDRLRTRYSPQGFLDPALQAFDNDHFRSWLASIGVPTYIGSSKRVFPKKGIKPIEVLNNIKKRIKDRGHKIVYGKQWVGWSEDVGLMLATGDHIDADYVVFSLGGGSWEVTGSDGKWLDSFVGQNIKVTPFVSANCAYAVNWKADFIKIANGKPLKNIAISSCGNHSIGEAVITDFGIEGNSIYALTDTIQAQLTKEGRASISIDLKPMLNRDEIFSRLSNTSMKITDALSQKVKLEKVKIQLLKSIVPKSVFMDINQLVDCIKALPIELLKAEKVDKAISTTGGVSLSEVDENYQLKKLPNHFVIGEMVNWNAPTGGYLLQACFSMGYKLAAHFNGKD